MKRSTRLASIVVLIAAGLLATAGAAAAPASTAFSLVGYEYAFTSTEGHFAGVATGNAGDDGTWNTDVVHDPLGSTPTYVDGGSFELVTIGNSALDAITGTFVHHGGTITTIDTGPSCTNQRYLVQGALEDVTTTTTAGGTGAFTVTLTHYRAFVFGRCVIYKARIVGTVSFDY
jgi:hypothetical protein